MKIESCVRVGEPCPSTQSLQHRLPAALGGTFLRAPTLYTRMKVLKVDRLEHCVPHLISTGGVALWVRRRLDGDAGACQDGKRHGMRNDLPPYDLVADGLGLGHRCWGTAEYCGQHHQAIESPRASGVVPVTITSGVVRSISFLHFIAY